MTEAEAAGSPEPRRLRLVVEYLGTAFHGWQVQPGVPTVQGVLEEKLAVLCRHPVRVFGAGRTDAGVHALAQVAHFDTRSAVTEERLLASLNGTLPQAVSCLEVSRAPADFDARGWATGKVYRYVVLNRRARPALERGRCWHVARELDVAAMRTCLAPLLGRHDFSAFRAADCQNLDPVKELRRIDVAGAPGGAVTLELEGSGFLKQMVRAIVGTAVEVGLGRRPAGDVGEVLRSRDRTRAGATAPAHGLYLVRVLYGGAGAPSAPPPVTGVHHAAVKARDVEAVAAFYRDVLGLRELARHSGDAGALRSVWLDAGGSVVMVERSGAAPPAGAERRTPFAHDPPGHHLLALATGAGSHPRWRRWLAGRGVEVEHATAATLYVRDPEGNRVGLSCWPESGGGGEPGG